MNLLILSRFAKQMFSRVLIRKREIAYPIVIAILALVYLAAGRFGLRFAVLHENVTLVWGASAFALAALLLEGLRLWPGVALGAFLVNIATGIPLSSVIIITIGNTLGPLLAAYLPRRVVPIHIVFDRIADVLTFVIGGVLVSGLVASLLGTFALVIGNTIPLSNSPYIWLEWLMGDTIGILILTPLILVWWNDYELPKNPWRWFEFALLVAGVVTVSNIAFQYSLVSTGGYPLKYVVIPLSLWAAFRFSVRGSSTISVVISLVALADVAQQLSQSSSVAVHQDLIYLWSFVALITICTMVIAVIVADRTRIERELVRERDYIAQIINVMAQGVAVTDLDGRFEYVNPAYADMLGHTPEELIGKIPNSVLSHDERATVSNTSIRLNPDFRTAYETRFHRDGRDSIDVLVNGALRRDGDRTTGIITSITDLTEQKKTEIALRRNEALLQTIFKNVPFDLWVRDADGRCIFQTPESVSLRGKLLGTTIEEMDVSEEVRQQWRISNARVIAGETLKRDVSYIINGEERHFFAVTSPVADNSNKLGLMGINIEITERVKAQDALRKSEETARIFLEHLKALQDITIELSRIDDFDEFCFRAIELGRSRLQFERLGLWLVDPTDPTFTIGTYGTAEDGTIRDERSVRAPTTQILPQLTNVLLIDDKKIYFDSDCPLLDDHSQPVGHGWKAMGHLMEGEQIIGGVSTDNFFSQQPAQQHQLELLRLYGNVLGHLCVLKRAEASLHSSEARFRSIFSGAKVGIVVTNAGGYMISANPAFEQLLGYTQYELSQMTFKEITHPDDLEISITELERLVRGECDFYQIEKRHKRKNGEYVWVRLNVSPFPGSDERQTIATVENIDDRKRAEAEIQQLNASLEQRVAERTLELQAANERLTELDRLKTKFIADVTHELRTPLTVLNTRVYLLQHSPPEKHPAYLLGLKEQLERLTNFVNATLDLSRLELGHDKIAFGAVDLNDVVKQVVTALQPRAEIAALELTLQNDSIPEIRGEFNQLAQVVTNLVANAINYTSNGSISIRTSFDATHNWVALEVKDTGMGISEADIPHLFTRFYRGERAGQSSIPGTGLGLSIVKEIVDLHQGQITVKSQVGKGTTFTVFLPIYKPDATSE
ncbi:MAG: PAS domain S-box protein [Anaerolineaceae bacterium]|nr:PAS domain S-box protein [Anaerolineaceae bacterium]